MVVHGDLLVMHGWCMDGAWMVHGWFVDGAWVMRG